MLGSRSDLDELFDDPQTGDSVIIDMGMGRYENTVTREGDTVRFRECGAQFTIEDFQNYLVDRLESICAVRLARRTL